MNPYFSSCTQSSLTPSSKEHPREGLLIKELIKIYLSQGRKLKDCTEQRPRHLLGSSYKEQIQNPWKISPLLLAGTSSHTLGSPCLSLTMAVARMGHETTGELFLHPSRNRNAQTTNISLHPDEKQTLAKSGHLGIPGRQKCPWEGMQLLFIHSEHLKHRKAPQSSPGGWGKMRVTF